MNPQSIEIRDATAGTSARILVGFGFNCYSFKAMSRGHEVEVLWSAPGFEQGNLRASHSGIPILFPFPGRIGGTRFVFQGKSYELEASDGRGNAIHGFVLNRPWELVEQTDQMVVGQFQASKIDPSLLDRWPADFRLTVRYELAGNTLDSQIIVDNPDDKPLPFGLGTHPYFRVPLGGSGAAGDCVVTLPAKAIWELKEMLATGKKLPAAGTKALIGGLRFSATSFDDVFTALNAPGGRCEASISDPSSGRRLKLTFDAGFRECVVYNPPHREAICIEPYTCVPDAFRLQEEGVDSGARELQPGETWQGNIRMRLE